jgi:ribosomal protein S18 acetylase RimI-like enzyme
MIHAFFDQMVEESTKFFNTNDVNRNFAIKFVTEKNRSIIRWLAEEDGVMIGYVFLWDIDTTLPWLGIAVHDDHKGRGIGKKLIEHVHAWAESNHKDGVILITARDNARGQKLYEGMGYHYYGIHPTGELLYIKRFIVFDDPEKDGRLPVIPGF